MIRLRRPLSYFRQKYGSYTYALDRLYLLMEKQHNRGQEAAGVGVINLSSHPGNEYAFRERALGTGAIDAIFQNIGAQLPSNLNALSAEDACNDVPFLGDIYMGHLRYSTTGRSGLMYAHPFLRRNNWRSRSLMLCGNFNMTNVDEIFSSIVAGGQHPRLMSDTVLLLEQLGNELDRENHRVYRQYRDTLSEPALSQRIEAEIDLRNVIANSASTWDGGYAICGATGGGSSFVVRDPNGIRPAFYYVDDEVVVVASERPVIQTVFNVPTERVVELQPGSAIIVNPKGEVNIDRIFRPGVNARCSFERVYFSRGSDVDIYRERKALGANIVPDLCQMIEEKFDTTVFSFIPNTAEVAFLGMVEELNRRFDRMRRDQISAMVKNGTYSDAALTAILRRKVRAEKIALKDIKLRTFIAEGTSRNDLAAHVYDITYGSIRPGVDSLVVIDDSIVRGTTLKQSILKILDRLGPERIIVVSSSPQVRFPDCYGIDLPHLNELCAFRAAVNLLQSSGRGYILHDVYKQIIEARDNGTLASRNFVKAIYAPFSDQEVADEIAAMLTPDGINARVDLLFQSLDGLHRAVPTSPGDWYFSGDFPTPGGLRWVNQAYIHFYETHLTHP